VVGVFLELGVWSLELVTAWTFIFRSLRFHARSHLGALLGAAVGSAVLIGALVVGDSVRGSLRDLALARLGRVQLALSSNDRFFRANLAGELAHKGLIEGSVAPVILRQATATTADESARANRVQLVGIDEGFWNLNDQPGELMLPSADEAILNEPLARQLKVKTGDTILLRVPKPSAFSREAPITPQEDFSAALRVKVSAIASDAEFGRFSLQASQIAPYNAFVSLPWLQEKLRLPGRANLLLAATDQATLEAAVALRQRWQLADAELELRELPDVNALELRTSRVFLDPPIAKAALEAATNASGVLTYFVNELRVGDRATPYSMVTAMGAPVVPAGVRDEEIIVNQWLADDLNAKPGDELELKYFVMDLGRKLEERSTRFRVHSIVPLSGAAADRTLMPDFPGLEKAESTRDWDPSLPVSLAKIRPKDEEYWKRYRGTPKAFITLAAGQKLWSNRFGNLTAVRYLFPSRTFSRGMVSVPAIELPPASGPNGAATNAVASTTRLPVPAQSTVTTAALQKVKTEIEQQLLSRIDPASIELSFEPVWQQALAAANQSQDFGGLFIGFSFFLIVAALLLMALLFQFGIEQRATEVGTLLALGFRPKQVRRLLLAEGGVLALFGGIVGVLGGLWYARAMLHGLSTLWRDAVGTSTLGFHAEPATLAIGFTASLVVAWFTIWLALRKQAKQPARELLAEGAMEKLQGRSSKFKWKSRNAGVAVVSALGAFVLVGWAMASGDTANAGAFFGAGALLLVAGLAFSSACLTKLTGAARAAAFTLSELGVRNCARRRSRSLFTLGLLACGSFLIASVGVFRLDAARDADKRSSGTGGFVLIGETTLPVVHDLNTRKGREFFGVDEKDMEGVEVVPLRVRDGDDASCLNLNRAQKPRLLGVKPGLLADRKAFTFVKTIRDLSPRNPWLLIDPVVHSEVGVSGSIKTPSIIDATVPAIGDEASIVWAMGKKVGDTIDYVDERGRPFKIRLVGAVANSILQGNLLIDEETFVRLFPSEDGCRMFLIDAPSKNVSELSATLSRALRDVGLELTPAPTRLAAFNAVQNTYLGTFQILGGLGLLLGSVGLGVVVMRNVFERRGELALLLAVGFRSRALKWLVLSEHSALLLCGLGLGVIAAAVAVLPALLSPRAELPYVSLGLTLGAVLLSGALWTWLATAAATRGRLLEALRNE
jgi:ABC-type antimicrobial peptide transport system permease subunit